MKFYTLIFYHLYKSLLNNDGHRLAKIVAIGVFSVIQAFNFATCMHIVEILFDFGISFELFSDRFIVTVYILVIIVINLLFFTNEQQEISITEHSKLPFKKRKLGAMITLLYGVFSVLIVVFTSIMRSSIS